VDSLTDFLTSWTFMLLMLGLLCLFVLLIPIGVLVAIVLARRAGRDNRDAHD
jgi:hypothetical protein